MEKMEARLSDLTMKISIRQRKNKYAKGTWFELYKITDILRGNESGYFFSLLSSHNVRRTLWLTDEESEHLYRRGWCEREDVIKCTDMTRVIVTRYELMEVKTKEGGGR